MGTPRVPCAGGIVFDQAGRLLLVQRGHPPSPGLWSVPGGRCQAGETADAACVREIAEETGLAVRVARLAGAVERAGPGGAVYVIHDFLCELSGGELKAADDATDARWVTRAELDKLPLVPQLFDTLAEWDLLPS